MSLTVEELRNKTGQTLFEFDWPVERDAVRRFANAVGGDTPALHEEVPPAFLLTAGFDRVMTDLLNPLRAVLHGSTEIEWFNPVKIGDVLKVTIKLVSVRKHSPLAFITLETEQHHQDNVPVARCRQIIALRSAG
ncbi:MAG: MaoC family dehydratase N-terminal domain-containing protein [Dehalococcoidia bacterium]|nr:MaoC family dehydratase N-terminal domain-containing protein [Dehalococcoidia bacterium]